MTITRAITLVSIYLSLIQALSFFRCQWWCWSTSICPWISFQLDKNNRKQMYNITRSLLPKTFYSNRWYPYLLNKKNVIAKMNYVLKPFILCKKCILQSVLWFEVRTNSKNNLNGVQLFLEINMNLINTSTKAQSIIKPHINIIILKDNL